MRVAVLSERASGTGAAQAAVELTHALNGTGNETCFFSTECGQHLGLSTSVFGDWRTLYQLLRHCNAGTLPASERAQLISNYHDERRTVFLTLLEQLQEFAPDIVHLHNVSAVLSHPAVVNLSQSWPTIWTLHDRSVFDLFHNAWTTSNGTECSWEESVANSPNYFGRDYLSKSEQPISFITPSSWLAGLFEQSCLGSNHSCRVIPNVVATQPPKGQWTGNAVHLALGVDKLLLAVIPRTSYSLKGFAVLREAFLGARARLTWAEDLDADDTSLGLLVTTKEDLGLSSVGIYTLFDLAHCGLLKTAEYLSQGEMRDLYRLCDALIIASRAENLPNVALEAIRDGCPILATEVGGIPEIVDDDVGILVKPGDVNSMAEGIVRMCRSQRRHYRESLSRRWTETYASEVVLKLIMSAYQEAMEIKHHTI